MQDNREQVIQEILKSFQFLVNETLKYNTKIYDGMIISKANETSWEVRYNGENHILKQYGNAAIDVGKTVKVFIPQGNQSLAYFM